MILVSCDPKIRSVEFDTYAWSRTGAKPGFQVLHISLAYWPIEIKAPFIFKTTKAPLYVMSEVEPKPMKMPESLLFYTRLNNDPTLNTTTV